MRIRRSPAAQARRQVSRHRVSSVQAPGGLRPDAACTSGSKSGTSSVAAHEYGSTVVARVGQQRAQRSRRLPIKRAIWLVEQQQAGLRHERQHESQLQTAYRANTTKDTGHHAPPSQACRNRAQRLVFAGGHAVGRQYESDVLDGGQIVIEGGAHRARRPSADAPCDPNHRRACRTVRTVPWLGAAHPARQRNSVDFPEPFGPVRNATFPESIENETSLHTSARA